MKNENKIILDLCGGTGSWAKPYKDAGYTVYTITLPENDVNKRAYFPRKVVEALQNRKVYGILAAPPCTGMCGVPLCEDCADMGIPMYCSIECAKDSGMSKEQVCKNPE